MAVVHRVDQRYAVVYQLRHILVAGGDERIHALFAGARRQGADDVVGLDPRDTKQGESHRLDGFQQRFDL